MKDFITAYIHAFIWLTPPVYSWQILLGFLIVLFYSRNWVAYPTDIYRWNIRAGTYEKDYRYCS